MSKIKLLVSELEKVKIINFIKFGVAEAFILFLAFGSFYTNLTFPVQLIICIVLLVVFIICLVVYYFKLKFLNRLKLNIDNPSLIVEEYNKRKITHLDILDYLNEKLIINEIIRTINNHERYQDVGKIGPWEIIYNHKKTSRFYQEYKLEGKEAINKANRLIPKLDKEAIKALNDIGIDYKVVYDLIGNELMYPVYGMLINDSQVLRHGLRNKKYKFNNIITLKPYETQLDDEDVLMLHIKVD